MSQLIALACLAPALWAAPAGYRKVQPEVKVAIPAPFPKARSAFEEAMAIMKKDSYNREVTDEILYYAALRGMLRHLSPDFNKDMLELRTPEVEKSRAEKATGEKETIGVDLTVENAFLLVSDVTPGSPAERAGIRLRDRIAIIDGDTLGGKTLSQAEALLHKPAGTAIKLQLEREGLRFDLEVKCEKFKAKDVRTRMVRGAALVRILNFSATALEDFKAETIRLKADKVRGIIVDLRGTPGGVVDVGMRAACRFLKEDVTVTHIVGRDQSLKPTVCGPGGDPDMPLVVLVDGDTASTAELFTAALKDNGRAKVLGTRTRGAGVLKEVKYLKNGYSFTLLTDVLYGPAGETWLAKGLAPDQEISLSPAALTRARMETDEPKRLAADPPLAAALALLP